jgi:hypothetical protein
MLVHRILRGTEGDDDGMDVQGQADERFGPVRECFAEVARGQAGTGAAFAAWCDGRLVADLWGGWADPGRRRPWEARSLVQPYSVSKSFAAVCALRLVEAGRLDLDAPVQRYWPQFRAPATSAQCAGPDRVFGHDNAWGLGFGISGDGYGMGGLGGSYGGTCTTGGYTIGFVTGSVGNFDRADALENTLRSCLGLPPIPPAG